MPANKHDNIAESIQRNENLVPRIVKKRYKLLYITVWFSINVGLYLAGRGGLPILASRLLAAGISIVLFVVAIRSFRGQSEPLTPRSWWRATDKPTAGLVLGFFLMLGCLISFHQAVAKFPYSESSGFDMVFTASEYFIASVLYFNSSVRLLLSKRQLSPGA